MSEGGGGSGQNLRGRRMEFRTACGVRERAARTALAWAEHGHVARLGRVSSLGLPGRLQLWPWAMPHADTALPHLATGRWAHLGLMAKASPRAPCCQLFGQAAGTRFP